MKYWKLLIGLVFSTCLAWADQAASPGTQVIGPFGMLNNQDNSSIIASNEAQDLLNVDITPGGKSVKKRGGLALDTSFTTSTSAVHGAYKFFDSSGNEVRLWGQDIGLWASVGGAAQVKVATGTLNATWQCTDYLGNAYCMTSQRDTPVKTNGTVSGTSWLTTFPVGTIVASSPDRIFVADTAANPERITYSGSGSPTDFTIGTQNSSSSFEPIISPGSKITHLAYRYGKILWWKDSSFGYIAMTNQFDLVPITISNYIGTNDNTDVYDQGITYFRGNDNQIWTYNGYQLARISRPVTPTLNSANKRKNAQWLQSVSADFDAGSYSSTTYNSTLGGVVLVQNSPPDNSFETASSQINTSWATTGLPNFGDDSSVGTVNCSISPKGGSLFEYYLTGLTQPTVLSVKVLNASTGAFLSSTTVTFASNNCTWSQKTISGLSAYKNTYAQIKINDETNSGQYLLSSSFTLTGANITFWFASDTKSVTLTNVFAFDLFNAGSTTGIYYSAVNNAANLTSWDTFVANTATNGGTHTFFTRSSTNTFTVTSSTPAWTAQTNGALVAASTGTYFQMSDTFTVTASSHNPILQNFTFKWFEGNASDKMYGTYFDYAIWFALSVGATVTTNNRILKYDLLNQGWTMYDIPCDGFLVYNNGLYIGDSTVGKTYKYTTDVTSDNGTAINSYWKSKDFYSSDPWSDDDLRTMSWYAKSSSGTTLSVTYQINKSTSTTYSINLYDSKSSIIKHNRNFPLGTVCNVFNVQVGDNSTNPIWEIFAGQYTYNPRPWNVYP